MTQFAIRHSGLEPESSPRRLNTDRVAMASRALFQPLYGGITANWYKIELESNSRRNYEDYSRAIVPSFGCLRRA